MKFLLPGMLISVLMIFSCNAADKSIDKKDSDDVKINAVEQPLVFDQLVGTWKNENGKSFEQWIKYPDGSYTSSVYSLKGSDTSWNEIAKIFKENGSWVFENNVKGQNDGQSVRFTSTILSEREVQFSNPSHDFPTDVHYTLVDSNTVHAFIIGPGKNGRKDTIHFDYTRVALENR